MKQHNIFIEHSQDVRMLDELYHAVAGTRKWIGIKPPKRIIRTLDLPREHVDALKELCLTNSRVHPTIFDNNFMAFTEKQTC